ncbi:MULTISPECIES: hypothetical protein [unclassified Acinetobacter]|uniref:hypothetical protein n=1 Tax=unclassified Acinetobacter TaxID=196816 RepID=UPI0035B70EDB
MKRLACIALLLLSNHAFAENYPSLLANKRLVAEGSNCAGMQFDKKAQKVMFLSDADCNATEDMMPQWRVRWLNDSLFVAIETERSEEQSPPRNYIYQIMGVKGKDITLKSIWTGWGTSKDMVIRYYMD